MRKLLLFIGALCCLKTMAAVDAVNQEADNFNLNSGLTGLHDDYGTWKSISAPFMVVKGKDGKKYFSSRWKGHKSAYKLRREIYRDFALILKLKYDKFSDNGGIYVSLTDRGKTCTGIYIGSNGTLTYFKKRSKGKYILEKVPSAKFQAKTGQSYDLKIKSSGKGKFTLEVDNKTLIKNIASVYDSGIDGILLWACSRPDQGGRNVLISDIILKLDPKTSRINWAPKKVELIPEAIGASVIYGNPVKFTIKNKPKKTLTLKVSSDDDKSIIIEGHPVTDDKIVLKNYKRGLFTLFLYDGKKLLDKHNFAVFSEIPQKPKDLQKEFMGMCTHLERRGYDTKAYKKELHLLKLMGIHWVRMNADWAWYHLGPKKYNDYRFNLSRKICQHLKQEGMGSLWSIQNNPVWAGSAPLGVSGAFKYPPVGDNWKYWKIFIEKFSKTLKGVCNEYEIWCEPAAFMSVTGREAEFPGGLNQASAEYAKYAAPTLHKNPENIVYGPAVCSSAYMNIKYMLQKYGLLWDRISLHYDQWPMTPKSKSQMVKRWIKKYTGRNVPILYSESGAASNTPKLTGKLFAPLGAEHSLEQYFMFWAEGIGLRHFIFVHRETRMKRGTGGKYYNTRFEPAREAVYLQSMIHFLRNASFAAFIDRPNSGFRACVAERDGKFYAVAWKHGLKQFNPAELIGKTTVIKDRNNNVIKEIGRNTLVYLYSINTSSKAIADSLIQIRPYYTTINRDVTTDETIVLSNPSDKAKNFKVNITCPGIKFVPESFTVTVKPGESKAVPVAISATKDVNTLTKLPVKAMVNGQQKELGYIYRFDDATCLKAMRIDQFKWGKPVLFAHSSKNVKARYASSMSFNKDASVLYVVFNKPSRPKWQGAYFRLKKPVKIPGKPAKVQYNFKLDLNDLPQGMTLLTVFKDASGQTLRYEMQPRLIPVKNAKYRLHTAFIDSPIYGLRAHSYSGGAKDGRPHYPMSYCGFILNIDPQVMFPESGIWKGDIAMKDIKVEYLKQ